MKTIEGMLCPQCLTRMNTRCTPAECPACGWQPGMMIMPLEELPEPHLIPAYAGKTKKGCTEPKLARGGTYGE